MIRKRPGIFRTVLAVTAMLSLLVINVKADSNPVAAGDQVWSQITMPYDSTAAANNAGTIRSIAAASNTTAFAATSNAVGAGGALSYLIKTTDGGKTWRPVGSFDSANANAPAELISIAGEAAGPELQQAQVRIIIKTSPNYAVDSTVIVALSEWNGATYFNQVYRSRDGGDTFKIMGRENFAPANAGATGERIKALAISSSYTTDSDYMVAVGTINPTDGAVGGIYLWQGLGFEPWSAKTGASDWYSLNYIGSIGLIGIAASDAVASAGTTNSPAANVVNFFAPGEVGQTFTQTVAVAAGATTATLVLAGWLPAPPAGVGAAAAHPMTVTLPAAASMPADVTFSITAAGTTLTANSIQARADAVYEYRTRVLAGGAVVIPTTTPQRVQLPDLTAALGAASSPHLQNTTQDAPTFSMAFPSHWVAATASDRNLIAYSSGGAAPLGAILRRGGTADNHAAVKTSTTTGYAEVEMQGTSSSGTVFVGGEPVAGAAVAVTTSGDGGVTWIDLSAGDRYGIDGTGATARLSIAGSTVYVATGGTRGGIFKGSNLGATWVDTAAYSDNINSLVTSATIDSLTKMFAIMTAAGNNTALFLAEDGGASWQRVARFGATSAAGGPISRMSYSGNTGYLTITGVTSNQVRKSTDGGKTWTTNITDPSDTAQVIAIAPTQSGGDKVWLVLSNNTIARTNDGGATWTISTITPPGQLQAIETSPDLANDRTLMGIVGATKQVYISRDEGATWTEFGAIVPGGAGATPGQQVAFSPEYQTDRLVYVGIEGAAGFPGGVYYLKDDGSLTSATLWVQLTPSWNPDGTFTAVNGTPGIGFAANGSVAGHESTGNNFVSVRHITFSGGVTYISDNSNYFVSTYAIRGIPLQWRHISARAPGAFASLAAKKDAAANNVLFASVTGGGGFIQTMADTAAAPKLVSPADRAAELPQVTALTWQGVPNATLYEVALGLAPNLADARAFTSTETGIETTRWYGGDKLIENAAYYWAVREKTPLQGPWSEIRSFTVGVVTVRPTPSPSPPANPSYVTTSIAAQLIVVWGFYAPTQTWLVYDPMAPPPANNLTHFEEGQGYWIHVNGPATLTYRAKTRPLLKGWNLIAW